ncbi:MAG: tyrosine-type recombinase/integrase [Pseudonocardiaceae bacterium]
MTRDERVRWLTQLSADSRSVSKDLPDLVWFLLATGMRIGEALALAWDAVDLDAAEVTIAYTLIRIKGQGLLRKSTKTAAGMRTLSLSPATVAMLRRRRRTIGTTPVFPAEGGGWRDPYNIQRDLRNARGTGEFAWVSFHTFRKTVVISPDSEPVRHVGYGGGRARALRVSGSCRYPQLPSPRDRVDQCRVPGRAGGVAARRRRVVGGARR